jgi:hypothetical protein
MPSRTGRISSNICASLDRFASFEANFFNSADSETPWTKAGLNLAEEGV